MFANHLPQFVGEVIRVTENVYFLSTEVAGQIRVVYHGVVARKCNTSGDSFCLNWVFHNGARENSGR